MSVLLNHLFLHAEMSTISHAAYLSELYNIRNMCKAQSIDIAQLNIRLTELEKVAPKSELIHSWLDGSSVTDKAFDAKTVYDKVQELIADQESKDSEIIEKIDGLTELVVQSQSTLDEHTLLLNTINKTVQDIKVEIENSVEPMITEVSTKVDKVQKIAEKNLIETTEIKGILTDSVITHLTTIDSKNDMVLKKLITYNTTMESVKSTVNEILELVKSK